MTRTLLLATAALAGTIAPALAVARPMTATDMHMMRRLGAPSVSPDGRTAIFTLSTTDLAANKRNNVVHSLDLTRPGAVPQPLAGLPAGAHDAVFGADGAIWFIAPAGKVSQVFRKAAGSAPTQVTSLTVDISGFTNLSERLAGKGRIGAEELILLLSGAFEGLIGVAHRYDGDVLKFRGDALLLFFDGPGHERRAAQWVSA